jgi:hypothetical protein
LQDGAIGEESLCCPGSGRTIKAGRRKLSRKENGKPPPRLGELRVHIAESGDGGKRGSRMSLKTRHFFTVHSAQHQLAEI